MKLRLAFLTTFLLLSGSMVTHGAPLSFDRSTQVQINIGESDWYNYPSHLAQRRVFSSESDDWESFDCPNWLDNECGQNPEGAKISYFGTIVFPMCSTRGADFCVEKLEFQSKDGKWKEAQFNRHISGPKHAAVPEIGFPTAGTVPLFAPRKEDKVAGIDGYAVYASVEVFFDPAQTSQTLFSNLDLRVMPFNEVRGNFVEQRISSNLKPNGRNEQRYSDFGEGNAWAENGVAGKALEFSQLDSIRLITHIPSSVTGWLGGRLSHAEFGVTAISKSVNRLIISGNPVKIGRAVANFERSDPPEYFKDVIQKTPNSSAFGYRGSNGVFAVLEAIRGLMSDKSYFEEVRWAVESYKNSTQPCLKDSSKLVGLVTSNATVFMASPPEFANGALKYQVGGLHYQSNGSLTLGQYDLVMRSEVARCLYKYSSAPIQGSISVVYDSGASEVSTFIIDESNGWLHLGAYNFNFSSPMIEIRLTQNHTVSKITPKSVTIICIKGKVLKKVIGLKPKCPTGFTKR